MITLTRKTTGNGTWAEIKELVRGGNADVLSIGDEVHDTLTTGEEVTFVVTAIDLYAEKQVIFSLKDCLNTRHCMNSEWTNKGGWAKSDMRRWLNSEVFETLSDDLKAIIAERSFSKTCKDKLWLFSEVEMFGKPVYGKSDANDKQMPLYLTERSRVKEQRDYGTYWYWLRSPGGSGATGFCLVGSGGAAGGGGASYSFGVAFGFCI